LTPKKELTCCPGACVAVWWGPPRWTYCHAWCRTGGSLATGAGSSWRTSAGRRAAARRSTFLRHGRWWRRSKISSSPLTHVPLFASSCTARPPTHIAPSATPLSAGLIDPCAVRSRARVCFLQPGQHIYRSGQQAHDRGSGCALAVACTMRAVLSVDSWPPHMVGWRPYVRASHWRVRASARRKTTYAYGTT
jgi:hypothetical protein